MIPHVVYVLDADQGVKVGISASLEHRCADLERAFGMPFTVLRSWEFASRQKAWQVEQHVHLLLAESRTFGEWFHCHPLEAVAAVDRALRASLLDFLRLREAQAA